MFGYKKSFQCYNNTVLKIHNMRLRLRLNFYIIIIINYDNFINHITFFFLIGLWWPTCELFGWRYEVNHYFPISEGICFVRKLIEKQTFVTKPLIILTFWSVILVMITIVGITNTKNEKRYNKFQNIL